jgi:hypothetical protein
MLSAPRLLRHKSVTAELDPDAALDELLGLVDPMTGMTV